MLKLLRMNLIKILGSNWQVPRYSVRGGRPLWYVGKDRVFRKFVCLEIVLFCTKDSFSLLWKCLHISFPVENQNFYLP